MIIENVKCYTEKHTFEDGELWLEAGRIRPAGSAAERRGQEILNGAGCCCLPGLIDMHLHGCMGYDLCDGTEDALTAMAAYEASVGVTAMVPALMTLPEQELEKILRTVAHFRRNRKEGEPLAELVGIHAEGPFISPARRGAQDERNIRPADTEAADRLLESAEGLIRILGFAPEECPDSAGFIRAMKDRVIPALGHTNADYDTARRAFEAGACHVIHLYNAMPPFGHREPGVIGAAADCAHVTAELICDGVHVHPSAVRAAFRLFGSDRLILISDSMRAAGMPDGTYTLGGLPVKVQGKEARMERDHALAGSVTNLWDCLRTAVLEMGIPLEQAAACVTENPARRLGIWQERGSLTPGKRADIVLMDRELHRKAVILAGKRIS